MRDGLFIVSKVYPHNASRDGAVAACERSLKRLETDRLDLYLLHWRGSIPLAETVEAFERLRRDGKIRNGASAISTRGDMDELAGAERRQLRRRPGALPSRPRGTEWQLLPRCRKRDVMVMAYSPLGQGRMLGNRALARSPAGAARPRRRSRSPGCCARTARS